MNEGSTVERNFHKGKVQFLREMSFLKQDMHMFQLSAHSPESVWYARGGQSTQLRPVPHLEVTGSHEATILPAHWFYQVAAEAKS